MGLKGYMTTMANQGIPEDMKGKDRIDPDSLAQLFIKNVSVNVLVSPVFCALTKGWSILTWLQLCVMRRPPTLQRRVIFS